MCDTMVRVEDGRVLFAKNSDRDPNEAQFLEWHPRREHPPGSRLRCTWIEIPQVDRTLAVLLSRPFWMWGAEMGTNEHGVTIGNEAVFTRQPLAASGLTGMDLLRLGLERADTAERAVATIQELLTEFGQGGGCGHEQRGFRYHNSFLVADPRRAFVLETAGRYSAVEEVRGARSISNGLTIPAFARQYGETLKTRVAAARQRQGRTACLVERVECVGDLMRILRDHGTDGGEPRYRLLNGGMAAPCMHAGGMLAASQTTASWVAELVPGGGQHWATGTAAPCLGLFKPVRLDQPLDLGPPPTDQADPGTLWWRHERMHRLVLRDPPRLRNLFVAERDAVEREWQAHPRDPAECFAQADRLLERWTREIARAAPADRRGAWLRRYWGVRDTRAGLAEAFAPARAS